MKLRALLLVAMGAGWYPLLGIRQFAYGTQPTILRAPRPLKITKVLCTPSRLVPIVDGWRQEAMRDYIQMIHSCLGCRGRL